MSDTESRALARAAVLLLVASLFRAAWRPHGEAPTLGDGDVLPELLAETRARTDEAERRSRPLRPDERLDANQASEAELDRLPGVGPATARAWVETRDARGGFRDPSDLEAIPGIGPAAVAKVTPHLTFYAPAGRPASGRLASGRSASGRPPASRPVTGKAGPTAQEGMRVDVNRADTVALQALPGVGPALARRIVQAREESRFRGVEDLLRVRGIGPATLERLRPLVTVGR